MPRIPTREELVENTPGSPRSIVQGPTDNIGEGMQRFGQGIEAVGDALQKYQDRQKQQDNALDYARARSTFSSQLATAESQYQLETDPDYGTWGDRFSKRTAGITRDASRLIRDPQLRARFEAETLDDTTRYTLHVQGRASAIAKDRRAAEAQDTLEADLNTATLPTTPKFESARLIARAQSNIDNLVQTGVFAPERGVALRRGFTRAYANALNARAKQTDPGLATRTLSGGRYAAVVDDQLHELQRQAESSGNANALGPPVKTAHGIERAVGSMQVLPSTAVDIAHSLNDKAFPYGGTPDEITAYLKDPVNGDRYGRYHMDQMLRRYGGDIRVALAAYNWGQGHVDRWLEAGGNPEALPAETRKYVDKIAGAYAPPKQGYEDFLEPQERISSTFEAMREAQSRRQDELTQSKIRGEEIISEMDANLASVRNTGEGSKIDETEAIRIVGPSTVRKWKEQRSDAAETWGHTDKMEALSDPEIASRVEDANQIAFQARSTPEYNRKLAIREEVLKAANEVMKMRREDPAGAALKIPQVMEAYSRATKPDTAGREANISLVNELVHAQASFGIPRKNAALVPEKWAAEIGKQFYDMPSEIDSSNREAVYERLKAVYEQAQEDYGDLADDVIAYSIAHTKSTAPDVEKDLVLALRTLADRKPLTKADRAALTAKTEDRGVPLWRQFWNHMHRKMPPDAAEPEAPKVNNEEVETGDENAMVRDAAGGGE